MPAARRPSRANPARQKPARARLWDIVEGAVHDAFMAHPEYLTDAGARNAATSLVKRIVGRLMGELANEAQQRRPLGGAPGERGQINPAAVWPCEGQTGAGVACSGPNCLECGRRDRLISRLRTAISKRDKLIGMMQAKARGLD